MQLTEHNIKSVLIDDSFNKAVFCLFYMDVPECQPALSALRAAVGPDQPYISLVLADLSEQVSQAIALQIGLRGVPALIVFRDGRPADVLQGDEVVTRLDELTQRYMPSEAELLAEEARALEGAGDYAAACEKAAQAYRLDGGDVALRHLYAGLLIRLRNLDKAQELLDSAGREERESQSYQDLLSALSLALKAQESPELLELEQKFRASPDDDQLASEYAIALKAAGKTAAALEILYARLEQDKNKEDIRKVFIDMLNTLAGDPLQSQYRRKLYTLMH